MKKREIIRLTSFMLAAIIAVGGFFIKERIQTNKYRLKIQNDYSKTLSELDERIGNIGFLLKKSLYSSDYKQLNGYATELYCQSELAKSSLSELPISCNLENLNKFLSQVGNYSVSISKSTLSYDELTTKQYENLNTLCNIASSVSSAISDSDITYNNTDSLLKEIDNSVNGENIQGDFSKSFSTIEESMTDYPTLVYDGPFSDHILNKEPKMNDTAKSVTKDEALLIAKKTSKVGKEDLEFGGTVDGKIEGFRFTNSALGITISKKGGFVVYMRKNRTIGTTKLSYEQALSKAKKYMEENGYRNMTATYYYTDEGVCVINFAYLDGQTICYPDLMKVGVGMDTGEIMLFESSGYLANHTERNFEPLSFSLKEAEKKVNKNLTVNERAIALIPTNKGTEERCFEFQCSAKNGDEVLVYINSKTLLGEDILILLKSDGGTLVK